MVKLAINTIWARAYPGCSDGDLIENQVVSYTDRTVGDTSSVDVTTNLDNFNPPPLSDIKEIKY